MLTQSSKTWTFKILLLAGGKSTLQQSPGKLSGSSSQLNAIPSVIQPKW